MDFKKPILHAMPTLAVNKLRAEQLQLLSETFDRLNSEETLPFPYMAQDPVRQEIDRAVAKALDLPDYTILRELLAREPVVCLQPMH